MKISELLPTQLTEAQKNLVIEEILPLLLIKEEDGGFGGGDIPSVPDGQTEPAPTNPPPVRPPIGGGYWPGFGNPWRPGKAGFNGNKWFSELLTSLKHYAVATRISKRLKDLGISGDGVTRVKMAQKTAAKHVGLLLNNPRHTAYKIPVWTTSKGPKAVIKKWNEEYSKAFANELGVPLMEATEVSDRALEIAAHLLGTHPDDTERVSPQVEDNVAENGKELKRQLLKSAGGNWFIVHYEHKGKKYARVESPEKKIGNKMYQVAVKTGPAEITEGNKDDFAWDVTYQLFGTNREVPLSTETRTIYAPNEKAATAFVKKHLASKVVSIVKNNEKSRKHYP